MTQITQIVWTEGDLTPQELADVVVDTSSLPQQVEDEKHPDVLEHDYYDNLLDIIFEAD